MKQPNIVWLMIDSLSGLYINKETMPYLSGLLDRSLYFTQCIVSTPYTSGAFYSMITGRYAQHNGYNAFGLHRTEEGRKSFKREHGDQPNLFSLFRSKGYHTLLDSPLCDVLNWCKGIDRSSHLSGPMHKVIERPTKEPFLWAFHHMGIHGDTTGNDGILNTTREKLQQEILPKHDKLIQLFIEEYTRPDDIIVLTSDHGITWIPHVEMHHGATLYESSIQVLFAINGIEQGKVGKMVRSVDVTPTVLHLIGEKLKDADGVDLLKEVTDLEVVIETGPARQTPDFHSRFGIRDNSYKYIFNWEGESLHKVDELVSGGKYISDDGVKIDNPTLLAGYRDKLVSYMDKYSLEMQKEQLLTISGTKKARNIVWLFIDSFSNLHINEKTMPFLNRFLGESLYFSQCISTVPYTAGCWYTQITGRYSQHHGYKAYWPNKKAFVKSGYDKQSSVVNILQGMGYHTLLDSPTYENKDWIDGFVEKHHPRHPWPFIGEGQKVTPSEVSAMPSWETDILEQGIERPTKEPFLWMFHYLGIHHITCTHMPMNMKREKFNDEVLPYIDRQLELFIEHYTRPDDIVIIASDHGSSWNRKNERHHGASLMESGIRMFFAIKGAGKQGRIDKMVRSIDVAPTLLGLLGIKGLEDTDGIDVSGDVPDLDVIMETGASNRSPYMHDIFGVRDNDYKYVFDWEEGESLQRNSELVSDSEYVCDDGKAMSDQTLLEGYRSKLLAYMEKYGLEKQKERLTDFAKLIKVEGINGCTMMLFADDAHITPMLLAKQVWGKEATEFVKLNLKPGQVFVDVGAHIGYYSLLASKLVGDQGKVFAFEPDPENFKVLQMNIALNHAKNVIPFQQALWDKAGEAKLYGYGSCFKMFPTLTKNIHHPKAKPDGTSTIVETVTLDNAIPTSRIDMIKVDVEGAEIQVLKGMEGTLRKNGPIIILEDHIGNSLNWLKNLGYGMTKELGKYNNYALAMKVPSLSQKFRFLILGVPHTKTTKEYTPCAFTMKVLNFCDMMTDRGHHVIHFGAEGSTPNCAEHVDILSDAIQQEVYGHVDWKKDFFAPNRKDKAYTTFQQNAISEIKKRAQPGDFLIVSMGLWQKPITDGVKDISGLRAVELGIGYEGCYLQNRIFESYAWMHIIYSRESPKKVPNGKWFDAVIPMYWNPSNFEFNAGRDSYFAICGRLITRKGVNIAQQVVDELVRQGYPVRLKVAGQGDPWTVMDHSPNVDYIGVVDANERNALLGNAVATFVPSVYLEPFGHVVIESYLCGTPVIATDFGAFCETVPHGHTGYRCRTFDQFVYAAKQCLDGAIDPHVCRKFAEDNYSYERVGRMYEEYFTALSDLNNNKGWYVLHPERTDMDWLKQTWPVF